MTRLRRFLRCSLFLLAAVLLWIYSSSLLWVGCLLLALFFGATDLFGVGKNHRPELDMEAERAGRPFGMLGRYVLDSTESYGLFLKLLDWTVFVDIREDELLERRKEHALRLFQNQSELEKNLKTFLEGSPDYRGRRLTHIGLHSATLEQGEVFWEPEGYILLKNLSFVAN